MIGCFGYFVGIVLVVFLIGGGVATMRKGLIPATQSSVVEGTPARVISWLIIAALPGTFAALGLIELLVSGLGYREAAQRYELSLILVGYSPLLLCPLIAVIIGFASAKPAHESQVIAAKIQSMRDSNPSVRRDSAYALGRIGPVAKIAIPTLTELLRDEDEQTRQTAAEALKRISSKAAREAEVQ